MQVPSLPVDAATQLKRDRRRAIAGMNAYRESLPEEVEGDYVATVDWEAEIAKAREEDFKKVLGIGEWFHDVPCEVKDCRKEGLTEAFYFLGVEARYNTRSSRAEVRHESFPEGWRTLNDRLAAELREALTKRFIYPKTAKEPPVMVPLTFGRDAWADTFNAYLYDREVDPFAEWLDALPRWDRVDRLDGWLSQVFTINDPNGLVAWTSRFMLLGAVTRAFSNRARNLDEMPVLIGRGGIGKSTALRYILPQDHAGVAFSVTRLHLAGTRHKNAPRLCRGASLLRRRSWPGCHWRTLHR